MSLLDGLKIRTVLQRCRDADVVIDGVTRGRLDAGLLALVGFSGLSESQSAELLETLLELRDDQRAQEFAILYERWWNKVSQMRLFADDAGRMNLSLQQMSAEYGLYLVSQFTLFADIRKGNRPSFTNALNASLAQLCFEQLTGFVGIRNADRPTFSGRFGADMQISFVNEGPVTILFDFSLTEGIVPL